MNIHDVDETQIQRPENVTCLMTAIFGRQRELMEKYHPIEKENGFRVYSSYPLDINHRHDQARMKDFAWRTTEELAEASIALRPYTDEHFLHFIEELSDALHFLTELSIICGFDIPMMAKFFKVPNNECILQCLVDRAGDSSGQTPSDYPRLQNYCWFVVEALGGAMNCLKNKPWKQSHHLTDQAAFYEWMSRAWLRMVALMYISGLSAPDMFTFYMKKSEVNKFRQRSQY